MVKNNILWVFYYIW